MRRIALAIAFAVSLGLLLAGYAWFRPWWRLPDRSRAEIDARWQNVGEWAAQRSGLGDPLLLRQAAHSLHDSRWSRSARDSLTPKAGSTPELAGETADAQARQALTLLQRWHAAQAGYGTRTCDSPCAESAPPACALLLYDLGRLALATSHGPADRERVDAVLDLAAKMRSGGQLLEAAIGFALAREVAWWTRTRRVEPWPDFAHFAPASSEIFPVLARSEWCAGELIASELASSGSGAALGFVRQAESYGEQNHPPLGIVRVERELLVTRDLASNLVFAAEPYRTDPERLAKAIAQQVENDRQVRRVVSLGDPSAYPRHVEDWARTIAEFPRPQR
jgi:hypothetical protein